jgi:hypothetical protein
MRDTRSHWFRLSMTATSGHTGLVADKQQDCMGSDFDIKINKMVSTEDAFLPPSSTLL